MSAVPWLIAGGAVVGLGILWYRNREAEKETEPPTQEEGVCDALAKLGVPKAVCEATGAGKWIADKAKDVVDWADEVWNGRDSTEIDANNKALNGEVEIPLHPAINQGIRCAPGYADSGRTWMTAMRGTVLRFKNGCVPFAGMAGWSRCAAGTKSNFASNCPSISVSPFGDKGLSEATKDTNGSYVRWVGRPDSNASWRWAFTGDPDLDPLMQGPFHPDGSHGGSPGTAKNMGWLLKWPGFKGLPRFPLPLKAGEYGYFAGGKPMVCPAGKEPIAVRDHRTGEVTQNFVCAAPGNMGGTSGPPIAWGAINVGGTANGQPDRPSGGVTVTTTPGGGQR